MIRVQWRSTGDPARCELDLRTDHDRDHVLFWETVEGTPPPVTDRLDVAALAALPRAMNFTQDLHLEGPVSRTLLGNLQEYVACWAIWRPDLFRSITITAEEIVEDRGHAVPLADRAVVTFSGGVDSTWTAQRHALGRAGHRNLTLAGGVLIGGFDIPLEDTVGYATAQAGARAVLAELGVPLVALRTNWRALSINWEYDFGLGLAATQHLFWDRAGVALVASDGRYDRITAPWGSNLITSPLLSSGRMRTVLDGAEMSRTAKTGDLADQPAVRRHLRVCWQGQVPGRNCGRCDKCVRTKLNFLAAGAGSIEALGPLEPGQLDELQPVSVAAWEQLRQLWEEGEALDPDLRWALAEVVERFAHLSGTGTSAPSVIQSTAVG